MKLTVQKQRELLNIHRPLIQSQINQMSGNGMMGMGIGDIINGIKKFLEPVMPIIKDIAPKILKEFVLPFIKKKMEGGGLGIAGGGLSLPGRGLKLAGQGKKPHQIKGSPEAKAHMAKLRAMKKK